MSYDAIGFRKFYFTRVGKSEGAFASYKTYLNTVDGLIDGGIDAFLAAHGGMAFTDWLERSANRLGSNPGNVKAAGKRYREFFEGRTDRDGNIPEETTEEMRSSVFRYEKELQQAVRDQIGSLEPGLRIVDGGAEATFDTGRSDILARDREGCAVVIELKAGGCPKGAIEQALGYAQDWLETGEEQRVRVMVVTGEFPPRIIAAAKRIPDLELKLYKLSVHFQSV